MDTKELKRRRERLGLTQKELAQILGIAPNTVTRYESGVLKIPKYMDLALEALERRQLEELKRTLERKTS